MSDLTEFLLARIAEDEEKAEGAKPTLQELAALYADHPDYREEWKP